MDAEAGRADAGAAEVRGVHARAAPTKADYEAAFQAERARSYPEIDDFCGRVGHDLDRGRLEEAARVLACPVKRNPPCWQHGRIVYAVAHSLALRTCSMEVLDVGTAKGFSALCAAWAAEDAEVAARVTSVDVVDPEARVPRNSVRDLDDPVPTVPELLGPWWPRRRVARVLLGCGSAEFFRRSPDYEPDLAFVDGKHTREAVSAELAELGRRMRQGAVVVTDDVHIPGVAEAVRGAANFAVVARVRALSNRAYAVLARR